MEPAGSNVFANASFARVVRSGGGGGDSFLVVIQNFRRSAGYNAVDLAGDFKSACAALSATGQRHPGFVVEVTGALDAPAATEEPEILDAFTLHIGTPVVLVWLPEVNVPSRCEVHWVGETEATRARAPEVLAQVGCAAVAGVVRYISSTEDGSLSGYRQEGRNQIGFGVG